MLRGHIDVITPSVVVGWAADDARPDKSIDISIFLDGTKVAQVPCNQPRSDLKALGTLGRGEHGFSYQFAPSLPPQTEARISVRVSETGEVIPGGLLSSHRARSLWFLIQSLHRVSHARCRSQRTPERCSTCSCSMRSTAGSRTSWPGLRSTTRGRKTCPLESMGA